MPDHREVVLPSGALFYHGKVPEPLSEEEREWLVEQLHCYPKRVNEARTCCISALTDLAVTEFCRLMAEREAQAREIAEKDAALAEAEFLCARLRDLEGFDGDDLFRQLMGHVYPSLTRLEGALNKRGQG